MRPEDRMRQLGASSQAHVDEADWAAFRERAHRSVMRRRAAGTLGGALLLAVVLVGAWFVTSGDSPLNEVRPDIGIATEPPSPATDDDADEREQEPIYLQQWYIENDKLMLHYGQFESSASETDAIQSLLAGVPASLAETGVETYIPDGTTLVDLTIDNGTANVTLAGDFPDESDTQQRFAYAQIVYTLTFFKEIDEVALSWESPESGGAASAPPETREPYHDLLPPIVVESPYPGEAVDWTFDLFGIANVYEATVSWRLVTAEGELVDEGFITATCGSGCWGRFEDRMSIEPQLDSELVLEVFESSAEDGSPLHMVQIPINLPTT